MTNQKIKLEIVSAEEELFSDEVEMVFAPAEMGEVGITPKHTPLITKLKPGDLRAQISKTETKIKSGLKIKTFFLKSSTIPFLGFTPFSFHSELSYLETFLF